MNQIMELMDKRAKAWEAAKSFLNTHSQNGGMVSAEDAATYDKMEKEVTDFTHDIERLQRQEEIDKMLSAPTSAPLTGKPGAKNEPDDKPGITSKAYKAAFWNNIRKRNYYDVKDVLEIGTDANGGYLVPDEYEKRLIDALQEENFFRTIIPSTQ
jgi:HK97 family phage major capsid protein